MLWALLAASIAAATPSTQVLPAASAFSVNDASANAGQDESFTVTRLAGGKGVYVLIETTDGTAHSGIDYTPVKQLLYFKGGQLTGTVVVHTLVNPGATGTLTFKVYATETSSGTAQATGSIVEPPPPPVTMTFQPPLSAPKILNNYLGQPITITDSSTGLSWGLMECPDESLRYTTETCPTLVPNALPTAPAGGWTQALPGTSNNGIVKGGSALALKDCPGWYNAMYTQEGTGIVNSGIKSGAVYHVFSPWGYMYDGGIVVVVQNPTGGQAITVDRSCLVGVH